MGGHRIQYIRLQFNQERGLQKLLISRIKLYCSFCLNSMKLNEKSMSFAQKLLTHYPISEESHCEKECSHQHKAETFQPFQHMHDHRKQREIYDKPTKEKLENMRYFKQMGNQSFKQKKYNEAAYFYQKAILYSDYTFPDQQDQINDMEVLVQQSNMNMAICLIKQGNWSQCLIYLREATKAETAEKDPKLRKTVLNSRKKAHYWLAKYYIHEANFQSAGQQIEMLRKLDSEVSSKQQADELSQQVALEMKKYDKNTEALSKKMFSLDN